MADIRKAGLCTIRDGRILLCRRNRGHQNLILPGGKLEPGETAKQCLRREIREELGEVKLTGIEYLGTYVDVAAGSSKTVEIQLYRGDLEGEPVATSEIGELIWYAPGDKQGPLAASLVNKIFPDLIARGILRNGRPRK